MKVSVIIPTYKPGDYLEECLASLGVQTLDSHLFETIIILNGCDEPWNTQVNDYIRKYLKGHNTRLIQTNQPGVSNARNMALDIASGEYITFIDDDDYISPSYLEELLEKSSEKCVALSDSIYFNDKTGELDYNNAHHLNYLSNIDIDKPSLFAVRVFFNGPVMKMLHRNIIGNRRFDRRFANGEDSLFMMLISDKIERVAFTSPKAVYFRRIRNGSATTKPRNKTAIWINYLALATTYTKYYFSNPMKYNWPFVLSRYLAIVKGALFN